MCNHFYKSIAKYYDYIFSYNPDQKDFILSMINELYKNRCVLDIGCGTGNLTIELSKLFEKVIGIDLDVDMINIAESKKRENGNKIDFKCLNMLEIKNHFTPLTFDLIVSFGNTLVHLNNSEEIEDFLKQTKIILKPGGKLLLQIINYDRILAYDIQSLPLIQNENIKFERYYKYHAERKKIIFETILTVKERNRVIKKKVELYPILKNEIKNILSKAGFATVLFYGNFKKENITATSVPLIIEAH